MYIFFLIINFIFAFIFYIFTKYIEAIIFFVIWIMMFFYFSPLYFWKKSDKPWVLSKFKISKDTIKKSIPLLQKASYIIAFILFYLSIYWISYSFDVKIFYYIVSLISIIILGIYLSLVNKQKIVVNILLRANFIILSFLYIIFIILYNII